MIVVIVMIVMIVMIVIRRCVVLCEPGSTLLEVGKNVRSCVNFNNANRPVIKTVEVGKEVRKIESKLIMEII